MTAGAAEQRWVGWQTIDTGRLALLSCSALLVVVASTITATRPNFYHLHVALAFGLYIAFGELLRLVLPGGREAAPIAMSAALSYAMVLTVASRHPVHPLHPHPPLPQVAPTMQIVVVAATGMVIGSLPHIAAGRRAGLTGMSAR